MSFQRGDVVRQTNTGWIGVVEYMETIRAQDVATDYGKVIWFEGRNSPSSGGYHFTLATHPFIEKIDGYEFEAALALGDTITAQKLYRAEKKRMDGWQEHFQPLIDQYGAAEIAWIAGSIAAMVATGQFTPEDAIRYWSKPKAVMFKTNDGDGEYRYDDISKQFILVTPPTNRLDGENRE